jgi:hypothetical protein
MKTLQDLSREGEELKDQGTDGEPEQVLDPDDEL